jgi:hypothetical protein
MVTWVRQQFVEEGLEAVLSPKQRETSARIPIFDGEKQARLTDLTCSTPMEGHARSTCGSEKVKWWSVASWRPSATAPSDALFKNTRFSLTARNSGASRRLYAWTKPQTAGSGDAAPLPMKPRQPRRVDYGTNATVRPICSCCLRRLMVFGMLRPRIAAPPSIRPKSSKTYPISTFPMPGRSAWSRIISTQMVKPRFTKHFHPPKPSGSRSASNGKHGSWLNMAEFKLVHPAANLSLMPRALIWDFWRIKCTNNITH